MSWERAKLKDICFSISDGDHQAPPKTDKGIPFVTISNITATRQFDFSNTMFVPVEYYTNLDEKRKPKTGDILYSVVGSFGIPVLIKSDREFVFQRHIAILRSDIEKVDTEYLYYVMCSRDFYMKADASAIGAAQRTVSLTALRNFEIDLPPLEIQHRIANILSAYDAIIENNQKQIKLLEEAAQRLYKEWFVNLHFPGYENVKIVDGVPEGWKKGTLEEIADNVGRNEKKEFRDKYAYYLPIDCLPRKSLAYIYSNNLTLAESSLVAFKPGDILFGAMRPYFHKVVIARDSGLTRSTCFVINSKEDYMWSYLTMLLFSKDTINHATRISVGTTMPYVRWKDFVQMPIIIPSKDICKEFVKQFVPIAKGLSILAEQIINLSQARDRLLPKLISGEVEIV